MIENIAILQIIDYVIGCFLFEIYEELTRDWFYDWPLFFKEGILYWLKGHGSNV